MSMAKHLDALLLILTITFSCFTSSFSSIETTESPAQAPEESLLPMHEGTDKLFTYAGNGEIIDCVPLAEDIVTEIPEFIQNLGGESNSDGLNASAFHTWHQYGECPEGTVPRLRMPHTDEDFFRSMKRLPRSITRNVTQADHDANDAHEYAIVYTEYGAYYGGAAHISVWKPHIERANEFSLAQIWVATGLGDTAETIECGWHLIVIKKTGCYNLKCPGFNQISRKILTGVSILTPSQVNGAKSAIDVQIARDAKTRHWWLKVGNEVATEVHWGGEIINDRAATSRQHTATQMGSGFFPSEGASKAAHFHTLKVITNPDGGLFGDPPGQLRPYKTNRWCYDLMRNPYGRPFNGANFLFGGFGRLPLNILCNSSSVFYFSEAQLPAGLMTDD
uniref:Neprosin PEP catalytic domain-containing protein n=1 Tax=Kalanchoe fedtschenkoi TaxID=63787 RepID=A0A7N0RH20_KALFE